MSPFALWILAFVAFLLGYALSDPLKRTGVRFRAPAARISSGGHPLTSLVRLLSGSSIRPATRSSTPTAAGTIRRWNRAATALFGFSAEEALGQNVDLIIPKHLRAPHWRGFDAAMTTGALKLAGRPTPTRATHKSGHTLYVEMTFALVVSEGAADGSVAIARDVTERIAREQAAAVAGKAPQR